MTSKGFNETSDHISESVQLSRVLRPNPEEQAFHHYLTLGIEDTLQAHPLIRDIKMIIRPPVVPGVLLAWERKHKRKLPMDLKNYYYSTNGFRLTWNLDYGGELLRVGEMNIHSLNHLIPLEGAGKTNDSSRHALMTSKHAYGSTKSKFIPDYSSKVEEQPSCPRISFTELQKLKNEAMEAMPAPSTSKGSNVKASQETTQQKPAAGKHGFSKSLILPPDGQAFQLDSSKLMKAIVCLVYLQAPPQVSQRSLHGTPSKKKPNQFQMVDFECHEPQKSLTQHKPAENARVQLLQSSESAAGFNKSIEEMEEEREVTGTESSFCSGGGYLQDNVQIWFLDPSLEWHYLAPTFSHYYKMLLYHLGLPEWEYHFTPYGLTSYAEEMFWIVAPQLLQPVKKKSSSDEQQQHNIWSTDYPTEAGKPNPVNNAINMNLFKKKKRDKKSN